MFLNTDKMIIIIIVIIIMIYCRLQRPISKELSLSAIYKNMPQIFTTSVTAAWWPTNISCSLSQAPPRLATSVFS